MRTKPWNALIALLLCAACDASRPTVPYTGHIVLAGLDRADCAAAPAGDGNTCAVVHALHEYSREPVPKVRVVWQSLGDATVASYNPATNQEGLSYARVRLGAAGTVLEVRLVARPGQALRMSLQAALP